MLSAADVAARQGLRGYDAVHCAAAAGLRGEDVVAAAGDQQLLAAWSAEGLAVIDTNAA
jgi:2-hydroxychromene-2-carboxylate isomerase